MRLVFHHYYLFRSNKTSDCFLLFRGKLVLVILLFHLGLAHIFKLWSDQLVLDHS